MKLGNIDFYDKNIDSFIKIMFTWNKHYEKRKILKL